MTVHDLPAVNATLNGLSALLLVAGFICIRLGHKVAHRNCMVAACTTIVVVTLAVVYLRPVADLLKLEPFPALAWPVLLAAAAVATLSFEPLKAHTRAGRRSGRGIAGSDRSPVDARRARCGGCPREARHEDAVERRRTIRAGARTGRGCANAAPGAECPGDARSAAIHGPSGHARFPGRRSPDGAADLR